MKMFVAAIVAAGLACVLIANGASDNVVIVTAFVTAIAVSVALGVYDMPERAKHQRIKDAAYDQAA